MYGMMDTTRAMKAAQVRNNPGPTETLMPLGICVPGIRRWFTDSDFFMRTVHMLAPIKSRRLPAMAKMVETKNVKLFLAMPL